LRKRRAAFFVLGTSFPSMRGGASGFHFPLSFPRKRESSKPTWELDSRFRGNDKEWGWRVIFTTALRPRARRRFRRPVARRKPLGVRRRRLDSRRRRVAFS